MASCADLAKADGKDIVKRSSARRSRYLLVFNCQLAPAAAGRLGTLARLDTRNPVMYIDFPEGRLRLQGTLTFPRNKYLVLRTGNKEVLCEDVLESIVVFSEAHWVGTVEENPSEVPLPMPESLRTNKPHGAVDFGARSGGHLDVGTQDVDEVPEDDAGDAVPASQGTRRVSRHQSKKRQRYAEDSDASAGDESSDEENGVEEVKRLPKKKAAADKGKKAAAAPRGRRSSGGNSQLASQSQPEVVEM